MRYVGQRLLQFILVFIIVTFTVMAVTRMGSTDPVRDLAGGAVSEEQLQRVMEDYPYLDEPLPVQWVMWMKDILTGDWGYSYIASQSTIEMFQQRMPTTVFIVLWAIFIGLLIAVPLGMYSAYKRDSWLDRGMSVSSFAVISTPPLVIAVAFLFLVVSRFDFFPSVGRSRYVAPWDSPIEHFKNFFIPSRGARARHRCGVEPPAARRDDPHAAERLRSTWPRPRGSRRGACCGSTRCGCPSWC